MTDLRSCCQQVLLDHYSDCSARRDAGAGPAPEVRVTRYEVSCIPEDHETRHSLTIAVEYRGRGKWAVLNALYCLSASGEWDYEMRPSEREDEWLAAHRFNLEAALEMAEREAPLMRVNGWTVPQILADIAARAAAAPPVQENTPPSGHDRTLTNEAGGSDA
jgi:hypothetical protein